MPHDIKLIVETEMVVEVEGIALIAFKLQGCDEWRFFFAEVY